MKLYCLSLYYKSFTSYRFLRKTFAVPSVKTLSRLFSGSKLGSGFSEQVFSVLKAKVEHMSDLEKYCSVCFDEMTVKCSLLYNSKRDGIDGFSIDGHDISKQALVFMAVGMFSNWKQPLGYLFVKGSTSAADLQWMLNDCKKLSGVGFVVKSIVCDQGTNNQKLYKNWCYTP